MPKSTEPESISSLSEIFKESYSELTRLNYQTYGKRENLRHIQRRIDHAFRQIETTYETIKKLKSYMKMVKNLQVKLNLGTKQLRSVGTQTTKCTIQAKKPTKNYKKLK